MAAFDSLRPVVSNEIIESFQIVWDNLGKPGSWWSGPQRIQIAEEIRDSDPPSIAERIVDFSNYSNEATDGITPFVRAVARKVAYESSSIDKDIFDQIVAVISEDQYAEIAAIASQLVPIYHLADTLGYDREQLPNVVSGDPSGERPDDLIEGVGFLPTFPTNGVPHVAVSLSLAQADNARRMLLVRAMYSGKDFGEMIWTHRNLSRPQIELVAARTSAINECFY